MNYFWEDVIKPVIELKNPKHIVEIGALKGDNTKLILEYCKNKGAKLSSIDPAPQFNTDELAEKYAGHFDFYEDLSLNALPLISDYEVILIDGDHNWYTVYNELKIIEKTFIGNKFPIIFFHDTCWPYGRRDLYYNPDAIPTKHRHPYKKLGMLPGKSELCQTGGMNSEYNNAIYENTTKNGIYTAIEDFIEESEQPFCIHTFNAIYGLTMLTHERDKKLLDYFTGLHPRVIDILEDMFIGFTICHASAEAENRSLLQTKEELLTLLDKRNAEINSLLNIQEDLYALLNKYDAQLIEIGNRLHDAK